MTELKLTIPGALARKARRAGLLTPEAIRALLREATRKREAAQAFLGNADRVAAAGVARMSDADIQNEVAAVRRARRRARAARGR